MARAYDEIAVETIAPNMDIALTSLNMALEIRCPLGIASRCFLVKHQELRNVAHAGSANKFLALVTESFCSLDRGLRLLGQNHLRTAPVPHRVTEPCLAYGCWPWNNQLRPAPLGKFGSLTPSAAMKLVGSPKAS
jgi:hypothetical protein